jgi:beta-glucanase (GH16 family)
VSRIPIRRTVLAAVLAVIALAVVYVVVISPLRSVDTDDGGGPPDPAGPVEATPTGQATSGAPAAETPAAPSGVSMPVGDLPGWDQVFADDFTGTTLEQPKWVRYDGQPDGDPGGWFDPSHVSVQDGKLIIGAWQDPARDNLYVTGGVSNVHSSKRTYGRYEIRFRADQGTGIAFVLLLWPSNNNYPPEIDIAEDNGRDRQTVYGVLHPPDQSAYPNEEHHVRADATQWHTAGLEWTPQRLVYTLDGEVWARIDGPQVPAEPMSLALQTQAWYCGHGWEACPDDTTPERVNLEIDWVAIYELAD